MSVRIGLGLTQFPFSGPRAFWRWVECCEASDIDSLWQTDRLSTSQPQLEPMALMAALAGGTERLKFGMNVLVLPLRDPLVLARQCATIDYLSGGRLLPAFGVGADTAPEWAATGRAGTGRGGRANEMLELLRRLWSEPAVTFEGDHFRYAAASLSPQPVQQPLPIWLGGSSPAAIRRTARYGTGWLGGIQSPRDVASAIAAVKQALPEEGRTIDDDHYGAAFAFRLGPHAADHPAVAEAAAGLQRARPASDARDYVVAGEPGDVLARIDEFIAAGASKFVLRPLGHGDDDLLDQTQRLIETVLPAVHGAAAGMRRAAPEG